MGLRAHLVGRLPLSSPWPPPLMGSRAGRLLLGVETLRGAQPPSPLYILEVWAAIDTRESLLSVQPYPSPSSSSPAVLGEALRDCHAPPPPHAVVLLLDGVFLNLFLSPCWIKAWETSPGCTCVERGGTVLSVLRSESTAI